MCVYMYVYCCVFIENFTKETHTERTMGNFYSHIWVVGLCDREIFTLYFTT